MCPWLLMPGAAMPRDADFPPTIPGLEVSEAEYQPSAELQQLCDLYTLRAATQGLSDRDLVLTALAEIRALRQEVAALSARGA